MAAIDDPGTAPAAGGLPLSTGWPMAAKPCDSCKSSSAILYCKADAAFLCTSCDGKMHGSNRIGLAHERVWMCEVCEQAPAAVTCKADAAALCVSCDADIHSANPLARRHDRHPVVPFFEPVVAAARHRATADLLPSNHSSSSSSDCEAEDGTGQEEAETVSWLLSNSGSSLVEQTKPVEYFLSGVDPYLDLDYNSPVDVLRFGFQSSSAADSLVPVQTKSSTSSLPLLTPPSSDPMITACNYHGVYCRSPKACFSFTCTKPSISHSAYCSSLDVGVVPDGIDISFSGTGVGNYALQVTGAYPDNAVTGAQLTGLDREARVLRYREKRKKRKFEKTIRYASRKAYSETRPRIKGRFAKQTGLRVDAEVDGGAHSSSSASFMAADPSYGVVPSF